MWKPYLAIATASTSICQQCIPALCGALSRRNIQTQSTCQPECVIMSGTLSFMFSDVDPARGADDMKAMHTVCVCVPFQGVYT